MNTVIRTIAFASALAIASPAFAGDWLYQMEQTRRFQKRAAEQRAAKEREALRKDDSRRAPAQPSAPKK